MEIEINKFYFYIYYDTLGNPFLIGKGSNKRAFDHLTETSKTTCNIFKFRKIQKLLKQNIIPKIRIFIVSSEQEAYACEALLVEHFGRKGIDKNGILTNRVGGEKGGFKGTKSSNYQKECVRTANTGNIWNKNTLLKCKKNFGSPVIIEGLKFVSHNDAALYLIQKYNYSRNTALRRIQQGLIKYFYQKKKRTNSVYTGKRHNIWQTS